MRHYLIVLLRNLHRERLYAAINIAGLSLGIACCLMLALFLRSELTYDQHNVRYKQIYRVVAELATNGTGNKLAPTSQQLAPMLAEDYPEIRAFVRFRLNNSETPQAFRHGDTVFYWDKFYFVEQPGSRAGSRQCDPAPGAALGRQQLHLPSHGAGFQPRELAAHQR